MLATLIRSVVPASMRPVRFLENLVSRRTGRRVAAGPFSGMHYINRSIGSAYIPKLLGIYERELNRVIEAACEAAFPLIIDAGAAEGYYAVGMAIRNPKARVVAFELDEVGRAALQEMVELNHKTAAIEVRGMCDVGELNRLLDGRSKALVICDVEGYEDELLLPDLVPGLSAASLLVETHDFCQPGVTDRIVQRFSSTHSIEQIWQTERSAADFPFRNSLARLLPSSYREWAVSEWRPETMRWLWMQPLEEQ